MRIRELLLCSIDSIAPIGPEQDVVQQPMQSPTPMAAQPAQPAQPAATPMQQMASNEPPIGGVTPANDANLAQKIQRIETLRNLNSEPEAPASGNFYQRMLGRPAIPLK